MALAIGAWYLKKGRHTEFALRTVRVASCVALVTTVLMVAFAHQSAVVVAEEQPTKFAMMEGAYETEAMPLYALGWLMKKARSYYSSCHPWWNFILSFLGFRKRISWTQRSCR